MGDVIIYWSWLINESTFSMFNHHRELEFHKTSNNITQRFLLNDHAKKSSIAVCLHLDAEMHEVVSRLRKYIKWHIIIFLCF